MGGDGSTPIAVSAFGEKVRQAPKSWAEKAYTKFLFYNAHDKGKG